jgi:hypothetical protein
MSITTCFGNCCRCSTICVKQSMSGVSRCISSGRATDTQMSMWRECLATRMSNLALLFQMSNWIRFFNILLPLIMPLLSRFLFSSPLSILMKQPQCPNVWVNPCSSTCRKGTNKVKSNTKIKFPVLLSGSLSIWS